ncbi:MAG: manganese efflux pump, partial [Alistipes sp.]|nr:manganese efflux pump [Alistipes sp.]
MNYTELLLIAIGLSMDAFAVSIGKGLCVRTLRPRHTLTVGLWFGVFQALMPILGYLLAASFSNIVATFDHWIAFVLLGLIGINMIREALGGEDECEDCGNALGFKTMLVMAIATSIDALAVGI